jgi:hypothetical protein
VLLLYLPEILGYSSCDTFASLIRRVGGKRNGRKERKNRDTNRKTAKIEAGRHNIENNHIKMELRCKTFTILMCDIPCIFVYTRLGECI